MSRNKGFTMGHIVRTIKILIRSRSWSGQDLDPSKILTRARSWPKKLVQARSWSGQDLDPGKILGKNKILSHGYFIQRNGQQWLLWTNTDWILLQITHRIKTWSILSFDKSKNIILVKFTTHGGEYIDLWVGQLVDPTMQMTHNICRKEAAA